MGSFGGGGGGGGGQGGTDLRDCVQTISFTRTNGNCGQSKAELFEML